MLHLLHTSPVHVPVFDALAEADHPGLGLRHLVHEELLDRARTDGPHAVAADIRAVLGTAVAGGATAFLCTCSTIGGVAEAAASAIGAPVLRVDRPMAADAVAAAPGRPVVRIVVIAALRSTLEPTVALIREEAARAGRSADVRTRLAEGAWERFETGDRTGYLGVVAETVNAVHAEADAIVLAQASMAAAATMAAPGVPVLSSPRPGLRAAAGIVRSCASGGNPA
ncbi:arylsulfatase [Streptomyces sp. NPDC051219]|uniref:aspartate/glutamate racemase family protein n=1 Tax=Streptomyces sp. NPDC051219 TaxID=3155283 RepID=UPI00343714BA